MTRFARSTGTSPLDNDQLMAAAPSIFAVEPYHKMSHRYAFVPTIQMIETLRKEGYDVFKAFEARTRTEDKLGYLKHVVRMRHRDVQMNVNGLFPEVILMNSHDGASAYQLHAGIYRLVCSNGLVIADKQFDKLSIKHSGSIIDDVVNGTLSIAKDLPRITDQVQQYQGIELTKNEQGIFAAAAMTLRWDEGKEPIKPEQLLRVKRYADDKNDLWTTMNVVQENIIKGGQVGYQNLPKTRRRQTTRAVTGIDQDTKLNKALWLLTEEMYQLKLAS